MKIKNSGNRTAYMFLLPSILSFLVFFVYTFYYIIKISFMKTRGFAPVDFIGLSNYKQVLTDKFFWEAVVNTIYIGVLCIVVTVPVSLVIAVMINEIKVGKNLIKGCLFIPNLTSIVAASIIFLYILAPTEEGLINSILCKFGIEPLGWFSSLKMAPFGIVLIDLWKNAGYNAIIWLTGILAIPTELYEAAEIDGASKSKQFWYITIPQLRPVFTFIMMTSVIAGIKRFSDIWVIGGEYGSPAGKLSTIVLYSYRQFMGDGLGSFGKAAASTFIMFVFILVVTLFNNKVLNKED